MYYFVKSAHVWRRKIGLKWRVYRRRASGDTYAHAVIAEPNTKEFCGKKRALFAEGFRVNFGPPLMARSKLEQAASFRSS
jgi:hypothetical protein